MTKLAVTTLGVTLGVLMAWGSTRAVWAAERTWTGRLSDSLCGGSHQAKRDAEAGLSERECTIDCVKRLGRYVLVEAKGEVVLIADQDFAGLPLHADHLVTLTGELKGDAIALSKIECVDDRHGRRGIEATRQTNSPKSKQGTSPS